MKCTFTWYDAKWFHTNLVTQNVPFWVFCSYTDNSLRKQHWTVKTFENWHVAHNQQIRAKNLFQSAFCQWNWKTWEWGISSIPSSVLFIKYGKSMEWTIPVRLFIAWLSCSKASLQPEARSIISWRIFASKLSKTLWTIVWNHLWNKVLFSCITRQFLSLTKKKIYSGKKAFWVIILQKF